MESVQSTAASAPSSLASQNFIVKILGRTLVLRRLLSSSCNSDKIITVTLIPILSLLHVSQSLPSFQKICQSKHDYTRPILRNTVVFGGGDGIKGFLSPKSELYECSHAAVRLGNLILGDIISLLHHNSGGYGGRGGVINAALTYRRTVLQIVTVSLLYSCSSYV